MTYDLLCSFPTHAEHAGEPGWDDGVLGTTTIEDHAHGMICEGCAAWQLANQPDVPPPPQQVTVTTETIDTLKAQVTKATTIAGVKAALNDVLDALAPDPGA